VEDALCSVFWKNEIRKRMSNIKVHIQINSKMNDSVLIWNQYLRINEANLVHKEPLTRALEAVLKKGEAPGLPLSKEIKHWFLSTFAKWVQSPKEDDQKTDFIQPYQVQETDPDWAKKGGEFFAFKGFSPVYEGNLISLLQYLGGKDQNYLKSLYKKTVPQLFDEFKQWKEHNPIKSKEGEDYIVEGVYDGYPMWQLISNKAFREESMHMGNCVGKCGGELRVTSLAGGESNYFKAFKEGKKKIYSLRDPNRQNLPVATIDVSSGFIQELYGPADRAVSERYRPALRKFVEKNKIEAGSENVAVSLGMVRYGDAFLFPDQLPNIKLEEGIDYKVEGVYDGYPMWQLISNKAIEEESISQPSLNLKNKTGNIVYSLRDPGKNFLPLITLNVMFEDEQGIVKQIYGMSRLVSDTTSQPIKKFLLKNNFDTLAIIHEIPSVFFIDRYILTERLTTEYATKLISKKLKNGVYNGDIKINTAFARGFKLSDFKLPDLSNITIKGNFEIADKTLTILQGMPKKVMGTFSISAENLETLEGIPEATNIHIVDGNFKTLEGIPEAKNILIVDGNFKTLKGLPKKIMGTLSISSKNLESLEGIPEAKNIQIVDGNFKTLKGLPKKIMGTFSISSKNFESLEGIPEAKNIRIHGGQFKTLKGLPPILNGRCSIGYSELTSLEGAPKKINGDLNITDNKQLTSLEGIPGEITGKITISKNGKLFRKEDVAAAMERSRAQYGTKLESFKYFYRYI
jgi:hypothetical protein